MFKILKWIKPEYVLITIKAFIAVLLIICLFNMPRGYYHFVRLSVFIFCIWLAYTEYFKGVYVAAIPALLCAVLFNPVVKFYIPKRDWLLIYSALAICLVTWIVYDIYLLDKNGGYKKVERQATVDNPNP
ncbi:DUF6804 family protein [Mucilaginibacter terrae]|uniref:DUF6804 family protein n=1 Tax=Mucilaginibacter terrae TaxID=1955052 RepID=UPI0036299B25